MIWLGAILLIIGLIPAGILFYQNQRLREQVSQYAENLDINHKNLTQSLQRAQTRRAKNNEDLDLFAEQNKIDLLVIRDDLNSLGGRLEALAVSEAKTSTIINKNYYSDSSDSSNTKVPICEEDGRPIDIYSYTKRRENRNLLDSNGMRVADVSFSAAEKRPWDSKVYGLQYKVLNTIGRGKNKQVILTTELTVENPEVQPGKIFRIKGITSKVLQAPEPPTEFDWWDPSLYLIAQPGIVVYDHITTSLSLSLAFSIWSYGISWRFLGVSLGYDAFQNAFRASLIPVLYNVGEPLPFLSDLWIGLDVGVSHETDISIGLVIGTRL